MFKEFKGFSKIFSYTFRNQISAKSFIALSIVVALIFFLLPSSIMILIEIFGNEETATGLVDTVYVTDNKDFEHVDFASISAVFETLSCIKFEYLGDDKDTVQSKATENPHSLILDISKDKDYSLNVLIPDDSELNIEDADYIAYLIGDVFPYINAMRLNLSPDEMAALGISVNITLPSFAELPNNPDTPDTPNNETINVVSMLLTYVNIMLLYFLVLSYGTSVANSLVLEKSSKLMEFFLITVKPGAIMLGKVCAIALSGIMQFMIWLLSLVGGFAAGIFGVHLINPESDMLILDLFDIANNFSALFSIPGTILGILLTFAGFFMYSALAAIGGAIARKSEDLASTNYLFTIALVASLFITMFSKSSDGALLGYAAWHDFLPFTAVLVTPAHLMIKESSLLNGAISLLLVSLTFFLLIYIAGRLYKSMVFYKGNIPKIKDMLKILRNKE